MKVGIVVLNWNGLELLKEFIPNLVNYSKNHHIYLADNASSDASVQWVSENYPEVSVIQLTENLGYAGGYNAALKQVVEDVFCLINNDVEVTQGWCDKVVKVFEQRDDVAVLQPKIMDLNKKSVFEYAGAAGGFMDKYAYPYCRGRIFETLENDQGQYDSIVDLHWASGACLFILKDVFDKVGGFDERYFAHQEEIDLCWRVRHLGYKISIVPQVKVFHKGGGTLNHANPRKTFYNFRNSLYNIVKNDYSKFWLMILLIRMFLDGIAAIKFLVEGSPRHFAAVFNAHISFYGSVGHILNSRKANKNIISQQNVSNTNLSIVYQYFIKRRKNYNKLLDSL
jgi:hypothetical protein